MNVEAYWNLHKKQWSIRHKGRVIQHTPTCRLLNVTWVVQPGGNARVRREKRKNVHAFARGTLIPSTSSIKLPHDAQPYSVAYNPYKDTTFIDPNTSEALTHSDYVVLTCTFHVTNNYTHPTVTAFTITDKPDNDTYQQLCIDYGSDFHRNDQGPRI